MSPPWRLAFSAARTVGGNVPGEDAVAEAGDERWIWLSMVAPVPPEESNGLRGKFLTRHRCRSRLKWLIQLIALIQLMHGCS
jgi:hypothetical protein